LDIFASSQAIPPASAGGIAPEIAVKVTSTLQAEKHHS
jgi:hypothetical protein